MAANAAAAATSRRPRTWRTEPTSSSTFRRCGSIRSSRAGRARTADDYAVLQDLPRGQRQYAHSFPLIPTFDALSYFHLTSTAPPRHAQLRRTREGPHLHRCATAGSHSDVVVTYLRYYHAEYAPDTSDQISHILMVPLQTLTGTTTPTSTCTTSTSTSATNLPTGVVYDRPATDFTVDYATVSESLAGAACDLRTHDVRAAQDRPRALHGRRDEQRLRLSRDPQRPANSQGRPPRLHPRRTRARKGARSADGSFAFVAERERFELSERY